MTTLDKDIALGKVLIESFQTGGYEYGNITPQTYEARDFQAKNTMEKVKDHFKEHWPKYALGAAALGAGSYLFGNTSDARDQLDAARANKQQFDNAKFLDGKNIDDDPKAMAKRAELINIFRQKAELPSDDAATKMLDQISSLSQEDRIAAINKLDNQNNFTKWLTGSDGWITHLRGHDLPTVTNRLLPPVGYK